MPITYEELRLALMVLKGFCQTFETCGKCPLCSKDGDCQIVNSDKIPESWEITEKVEL